MGLNAAWEDVLVGKGLIPARTDAGHKPAGVTYSERRRPMDVIPARPGACPTVLLPVPPSANNLFATVRGRRVKSAKYREWLADVSESVQLLTVPPGPWDVRLCVLGDQWNMQRDLDNAIKPVLDSLVANGVLPNDCTTHVRRIQVEYDPHPERAGGPTWMRVGLKTWLPAS